jgi:hypothetical protein
MLNHNCTGIQKWIFDRICQIHDEIIFHDPGVPGVGERTGGIDETTQCQTGYRIPGKIGPLRLLPDQTDEPRGIETLKH